MPNYSPQNQYLGKNPSAPMDYDLQSEKQKIAEGIEKIKKELLENWKKRYAGAQIFPDPIANLSREMVFFLLSPEHTHFYDRLARESKLDQSQRDSLPQAVWDTCQSGNWDSFKQTLEENIGLAPDMVQKIAQQINGQILLKARGLASGVPLSKSAPQTARITPGTSVQMTLSQALKEIPEIGEQLITSDRINVLNFPEPVRPSIKNWLADYTSVFGYEKKDFIQIGNYLFHSQNTQKLSPNERQKLTFILKAFNENTLITIDKIAKQVVFNNLVPAIGIKRPTQTPSRPESRDMDIEKQGQFSSSRPQALGGISRQSSVRFGQFPKSALVQNPGISKPKLFSDSRPQTLGKITERPSGQTSLNPRPINPGGQNTNIGRHQQMPSPASTDTAQLRTPKSMPVQPQTASPTSSTVVSQLRTEKVSFSSPQKLGHEKLMPYRITPISGRTQSSITDQDKKLAGKNVVNLKEI